MRCFKCFTESDNLICDINGIIEVDEPNNNIYKIEGTIIIPIADKNNNKNEQNIQKEKTEQTDHNEHKEHKNDNCYSNQNDFNNFRNLKYNFDINQTLIRVNKNFNNNFNFINSSIYREELLKMQITYME